MPFLLPRRVVEAARDLIPPLPTPNVSRETRGAFGTDQAQRQAFRVTAEAAAPTPIRRDVGTLLRQGVNRRAAEEQQANLSQDMVRTANDTYMTRERELRARPNPSQPSPTRDTVPLLSGITRIGRGVVDVGGGFLDAVGEGWDVLSGESPLISGQPGRRDALSQDAARVRSGVRDVAAGGVEATLGGVNEFDRFTGAPVRGVLLNPTNPVLGAAEAFRDPQQAQLRNMVGIRSLPDTDIVGPLSIRDIVGGVADAAADVGTVARGAKALAAGGRLVRGMQGMPVGMSIRDLEREVAGLQAKVAKEGLTPENIAKRDELMAQVFKVDDAPPPSASSQPGRVETAAGNRLAVGLEEKLRPGELARKGEVITGGLQRARKPADAVAELGKPWPAGQTYVNKITGETESIPATRVRLKDGREVRVESFGDAVPGGYNGGFRMTDAETGQRMGYIDYQTSSRDPGSIGIGMVQVEPEFRRSALADVLYARLRTEFPDVRIDPGMLTDDGSRWWNRLNERGLTGNAMKPSRGRAKIDKPMTAREMEAFQNRPNPFAVKPAGDTLSGQIIPGVGREAAVGGVVGATGGYASDPDASPQEQFRNALIGGALGAAAGGIGGKIVRDIRAPKPEFVPDRKTADRILQQWTDDNRVLLDSVKGDPTPIRAAYAQITGEVPDKWVTTAVQRRSLIRNALEAHLSPEDAKELADEAFQVELRRRFPSTVKRVDVKDAKEALWNYKRDVPESIRNMVDETQSVVRGQELGAISTFVQRTKNVQFGLADFGIGGVQGLNAIRRNPVQFMAGGINRMLAAASVPHVDVNPGMLAKRDQYILDGVQYGRTGITQPDAGSLLQYLGKPGRAIDKPLTAFSEKMTDIQFRQILGNMREVDHEGNLVMIAIGHKLLPRVFKNSITDPAVRATSAANANHATSSAQQAIKRARAGAETSLLTSSSMARARVANIVDMAKLLGPKSTPEQRLISAATILGTVSSTLAIGQAIQNLYGAPGAELVLDPSLPGFGMVTTRFKNSKGENIVIDFIPQDSVDRAVAVSVRALMEADPQTAAEAWAKVGLGSASIVGRGIGEVFRTGYDPVSGRYRFGDLEGGAAGAASRLAPVPPIGQSIREEGVSPVSTGLEFFGWGNYPESAYGESQRLLRLLGQDDTLTGRERTQALAGTEAGRANLERRDRETLERAAKGDRTAKALAVGIETRVRLQALADAGLSPSEYRDQRTKIMAEQRGAMATYEDVFEGFAESDNPVERDLSAYFDLFSEAETPWGITDDDRFEELESTFIEQVGPARWEAVQEQLGLVDPRLPEQEREYRQVRGELDEAGFFDIGDQSWGMLQRSKYAGAEQYKTYYEWYDVIYPKIVAAYQGEGFPKGVAEDIARAEIEKMPQAKAYSQLKNQLETLWVGQNPDLTDRAIQWGYFSPNQPERELVIGGGR